MLPNRKHHVEGDGNFRIDQSAGKVIITLVVKEFGKVAVTRAETLVALYRKVSETLSS